MTRLASRHRCVVAGSIARGVKPMNKRPSYALANRPNDELSLSEREASLCKLEPRLVANLCATPPDAGKVFDRVSPLASALRLCSSAPLRGAG
jgi:hypothetical protein